MSSLAAVILTVVLAASGATGMSDVRAEAGIDTPDLAAMQQVPAELALNASGSWVQRLNSRLADAGFHPDGGNEFGYLTRHAVFAFQKHHQLETTGVFTAEMWELLDVPAQITWRRDADRVEVDLGKQVLYLVEDNEVRFVLPISSGNGGTFVNYTGREVPARTPEGRFTFQRSISGMRISYLGALYNPFYFYGGYAIHGSPSVPNYPASHGCVRVTNWDMDLLKQHLEIGQPIYVYGLRTEEPPRERVANPAPSFA
ncbi:MAG TPA: L,D-transpeptidase family protein [Acidimicrobiia bacterium]|nr:L,D-transpeptidase family protein [Acidimicrobiia bacterium]